MLTQIRAVPGPRFAAGTLATTWLEESSADRLAWLLVGHPAPHRSGESAASIETALLGMVDGLRLSPAADHLPDIGSRVMTRGAITTLDYGHPTCVMRTPQPGKQWRDHVRHGGAICLAIGLDPLPPGAAQDAIDSYLHHAGDRGRLWMGTTEARTDR